MPTLSTIIPAYDQHEITAIHVREILNSTRVPDEIIVVNDGGSDNLKQLLLADWIALRQISLREKNKEPKLIYAKINEDIPWNYTGARNLGFWLSKGDYLALEDTDHIPLPNVYEEAIKYLEENKKTERLVFHTRKKVYKDDALNNPVEKWKIIDPPRGTHYDLQIMRRSSYARIKGFDERFAGKYAWACTDWRRRLQRANVKYDKLYVNYYVILDGETHSLPRLRSKENYDLAKQKEGEERIMSPKGILNFTYTYEIL